MMSAGLSQPPVDGPFVQDEDDQSGEQQAKALCHTSPSIRYS